MTTHPVSSSSRRSNRFGFSSALLAVVTLGLLLSCVRASQAHVSCKPDEADCLERIVADCAQSAQASPSSWGQCSFVDLGKRYAVLKVPNQVHYNTIPLDPISGIEDAKVKEAAFPNYWSYAWQHAMTLVKRPHEWMGLAINSKYRRRQGRMHIHMACVSKDVKEELGKQSGMIKDSWGPITLGGDPYRAMRIGGDDLDKKSPFHLLLSLPDAARKMDEQSLAVIGFKDGTKYGFYVLNGNSPRAQRAEGLLDGNCRDAPLPPAPSPDGGAPGSR